MNGGLGQLIKGVIIGVVLILAVIGSMSILDKNKNNQPVNQKEISTTIPAPSINIANQSTPPESSGSADSDTPQVSLAETPVPDADAAKQTGTDGETFKPVLENEPEKTPIPQPGKQDQIQYGMLNLNAVDFETNNSLTANFEVFNSENKKIAESKNTSHTSFRLPTGQYKIVTTLVLPKNSRPSEPVISTQFASIRANGAVQKTFKLEPPSTVGVLQVSAKNPKTKKIVRADYIIQKENGETIATRQNVASTLFKLQAGSYKVTVKNGQQTNFRTVVIEPGESTREIFELQDANSRGRLLIRIFNSKTNKPLAADITIKSDSGNMVQKLTAVNKTELSLPQGTYTIHVNGPNGQSSKQINIIAGRANSEIFRFDVEEEQLVSNEVQITDNVKIAPARPAVTTDTTPTFEPAKTNDDSTGKLILFARKQKDHSSVKSNFYIQTLSGKHVDKKIYANSAVFDLKPGTYKVTVRSKNKMNNVKTIRVIAGKEISETFLLQDNQQNQLVQQPANEPRGTADNKAINRPTPSPAIVTPPKPTTIPNGFLTVAMQPPRKTHFIISNAKGKKIVELTSVPNGKFKLDTGSYTVTAILGNQRQSKTVRVREGKNVRISFNPASFLKGRHSRNNAPPAGTGLLRSRIINQSGQPVKGRLTVIDIRGRVIAQANNVSIATFRLPPAVHTLTVSANGLKGSERVKIVQGETTVQTFTIIPPNSRQGDRLPPGERLRERLEQEIKKRF